jgi:hypothetical protein
MFSHTRDGAVDGQHDRQLGVGSEVSAQRIRAGLVAGEYCEDVMKLGRTAIGTLAASVSLLAACTGAALPASAAGECCRRVLPASAAAVPTAAHHSKFVLLTGNFKPEARPKTSSLACADDRLGRKNLHWRWTRWTSNGATGHGTFWENLCIPNWADGHVEFMPGHAGDRQHTRLTAVLGRKRPTLYKREHGKIVAVHPRSWTFHI